MDIILITWAWLNNCFVDSEHGIKMCRCPKLRKAWNHAYGYNHGFFSQLFLPIQNGNNLSNKMILILKNKKYKIVNCDKNIKSVKKIHYSSVIQGNCD